MPTVRKVPPDVATRWTRPATRPHDLRPLAPPAPPAPAPLLSRLASATLFPPWAVQVIRALLRGGDPATAYAQAGVTGEQVRHEQKRNRVFRQVHAAARSAPQNFATVLDRLVEDAVVAARVITPAGGAYRRDWQAPFLRLVRAGRAAPDAAVELAVTDEVLVRERWCNPAFAVALDLALVAHEILAHPRGRPRPAPSATRAEAAASRRAERRAVQAAVLTHLRLGRDLPTIADAVAVSQATLRCWKRDDHVFGAAWATAEEQARDAQPRPASPAPAPLAPPAVTAPVTPDAAPPAVTDDAHDAWDDGATWELRFFVALGRWGSIPRACQALGIDPGDVYRRWQRDADFQGALNAVLARLPHADPAGSHPGEPQRDARAQQAARESRFLAALRRGRRVDQAARHAGLALSGLYTRRQTDAAFRAAWDEAQGGGARSGA